MISNDEIGKVYGRLKILTFNKELSTLKGSSYVDCVCSCGNFKSIKFTSISNNKTKSCGCLLKEKAKFKMTTHGLYNHRLYRIYYAMKQRCYNKKHSHYKNYGGRGISICDEWLVDFLQFYNWAISNGYSDKLTIERVNVNDNYTPSNCKWITNSEQQLNKTNNVEVLYNNEYQSLTKVLINLGRFDEYQKINRYIKVNKFNINDALSIKNKEDLFVMKYRYKLREINHINKISRNELAKFLNIKLNTVYKLLNRNDFNELLSELNLEVYN